VANGDAIRRLVEFHVQYERAAKRVAEHGAILPPKNKRTKVGQWNPFWSVMRQADKAILALEAEPGLSPVRRGKAEKVQRGKTKPARQTRTSDQFPGDPRSQYAAMRSPTGSSQASTMSRRRNVISAI
jgi:hypothetical protein